MQLEKMAKIIMGRIPLNPNSEIETGNLPQSLGHKRIEKISTDHFGYASIFSIRFCSKILRHLAGLNFGSRVKVFPSPADNLFN